MSTPDQPKNYISKGISKTLLTPCRRIGLSRTKKTPNNLDSPIIKQQESTPVAILHTPKAIKDTDRTVSKANDYRTRGTMLNDSIGKENKNAEVSTIFATLNTPESKNFDKTASRKHEYETPEPLKDITVIRKRVRKSEEIKVTEVETTLALQNDTSIKQECGSKLQKETTKGEKNETNSPPSSPVFSKVKVQVHHPPVKRNINFNELEAADLSKSNSPESPSLSNQKKRKLYVKESDDSSNVTTKSEKALSEFKTEEYLEEYSKDPDVFASSLTQDAVSDDIKTLIVTKSCNETEDVTKEYVAVYYPTTSNHSDQTSTKRQLTVSLEKLPTKRTSSSNKLSLSKLSFDTENSDDEMFTSSPHDDKNRRDNLLKLIANIKAEILQKQETFEKLKQAQIYKKIHSIDKLKSTTDIWLKGCKRSLQDLLEKVQNLGPMDLNTLIKRLGIPDSVIKKLE